MKYVLMVINRSSILIHIGDPLTFSRELLADYAINGMTIKTVTFEEWKQLGYSLYEKIN